MSVQEQDEVEFIEQEIKRRRNKKRKGRKINPYAKKKKTLNVKIKGKYMKKTNLFNGFDKFEV